MRGTLILNLSIILIQIYFFLVKNGLKDSKNEPETYFNLQSRFFKVFTRRKVVFRVFLLFFNGKEGRLSEGGRSFEGV